MTVAMQEDGDSGGTAQLMQTQRGRYYMPLVCNGLTLLIDMASPRVRHGASPLLSAQQWLECARVRATPMALVVCASVLHTWPFDDECDNECVLAIADYINRGRVPSLDFVQRKQTTLAIIALRFGVDSVCRYADERVGSTDEESCAWDMLRFVAIAAAGRRKRTTRTTPNPRKRRAFDANGPYAKPVCTK